ncbi:MAG: peptidoglycan DD-metalloendopeptidase family protein [Porticoccaceae bacterium]|nr:peptidoglycan DD-metalloendopeptidase family protein [Porticoccaceae bacterium]
MKIILISNRSDKIRTISLHSWARVLLSVVLLGIPLAVGTLLGVKLADGRWQLLFENSIAEMQHELVVQQGELSHGRQQAANSLSSMTAKLAQMRARLVRLDALGEQLTEIAGLEDGEFDFSSAPGLGGPENQSFVDHHSAIDSQSDLAVLFATLDSSLSKRETQLQILRSMLAEQELTSDRTIAGRPITKGWMSSAYGMRTDPFDGEKRWHAGVDFAGRQGSEVIAVASGVVTWSAEKSGYGLMVEINHSDGYLTRYAHNKENIAKLGMAVKKGDVIAKMGSSGRSTGPHVHFEVFKNGRTVDPATYARRTSP